MRSRRWEIELRLKVSHREAVGDYCDPYGKIPEFTFCAVQIEPLGASRW